MLFRSELAATEAASQAEATTSEQSPTSTTDIPVSLPRMAYAFEYGFRLPGSEINALQLRHADKCEALGPQRCMIVGMTASGSEQEDMTARLELAVASEGARSFVIDLASLAEAFGGEQISGNITGEDLSRSIIDTEAHLRSRIELRDRLMEVLQTRRGTVEELVEAERGVAAINAEIDQARSTVQEMRGRVNYSRVVLNYESTAAVGSSFLEPVGKAISSLG